MKTRVAVMYGGRSVEHEVSVISGIQALLSIDTEKYETIPVYITKDNQFYVGEDIGKIEALVYDSPAHFYRVVGEKVGNAFKDGMALK